MTRIEDQLKELMLQNVSFILDGKVIKQGKIKIFNTKQNFIKFKIEHDDEVKEWELTYPFKVTPMDNGFLFDYSLSAFCPRTETAYWKMKLADKSQASKLYDNYLYVTTISS
jgi:hypothetical protein